MKKHGSLHLQLKPHEAIRIGKDTYVLLNPGKSRGKDGSKIKPRSTYIIIVAETDLPIARCDVSEAMAAKHGKPEVEEDV
jgi:hypothetical protein